MDNTEDTKMVDKYTAKSIFDSLCNTYEGNQQLAEEKSNLLIQQHNLFKMREDKDVQKLFPRF